MPKNIIIVLFLIICLNLTLAQNSQPIDPNYDYDIFMEQFNRTYQGEEKSQHEKIFKENYANLLKAKEKGLDVQVNDFMDWNETQKNSFNNYDPSSHGISVSSVPLRASGLFAAPASFDWRSLNRVTSVKNQGGCGSCWAFASTAQYQSALAIATNGTHYDLAEQYALECQLKSSACNGGAPFYALKLYNTTGIPPQKNYPYQAVQSYYSNLGKPICKDTNRTKLNKTVIGIDFFSYVSESTLQQLLVDYGPLTVGVDGNNFGFQYAGSSGGISCYYYNSVIFINHVVLLVGYNATHWFVKNSWGTNWGDQGYGYISRSYSCGISFDVSVLRVNYANMPLPPAPTTLNMSIVMTDTGGDGWKGMVIGFKQGSTIVGKFGANFTSGSSFGPVYVSIPGKMETQIVVVQKGSWPDQIGFHIKAPDGSTIYYLSPGYSFDSSIVFKVFCPFGLGQCVQEVNTTLYITMTDSWGDGWNGNVLALKQNVSGVIKTSTFTMTSGRISNPVPIVVRRGELVNVTVSTLGTWSEEVGYEIRNYFGMIVAFRKPGYAFYANYLLSWFRAVQPDIWNVGDDQQTHKEQPTRIQTQTQSQQSNVRRSLIIAAAVLSSLILIISLASIIIIVKLYRRSKGTRIKDEKTLEHAPTGKTLVTGSSTNIDLH